MPDPTPTDSLTAALLRSRAADPRFVEAAPIMRAAATLIDGLETTRISQDQRIVELEADAQGTERLLRTKLGILARPAAGQAGLLATVGTLRNFAQVVADIMGEGVNGLVTKPNRVRAALEAAEKTGTRVVQTPAAISDGARAVLTALAGLSDDELLATYSIARGEGDPLDQALFAWRDAGAVIDLPGGAMPPTAASQPGRIPAVELVGVFPQGDYCTFGFGIDVEWARHFVKVRNGRILVATREIPTDTAEYKRMQGHGLALAPMEPAELVAYTETVTALRAFVDRVSVALISPGAEDYATKWAPSDLPDLAETLEQTLEQARTEAFRAKAGAEILTTLFKGEREDHKAVVRTLEADIKESETLLKAHACPVAVADALRGAVTALDTASIELGEDSDNAGYITQASATCGAALDLLALTSPPAPTTPDTREMLAKAGEIEGRLAKATPGPLLSDAGYALTGSDSICKVCGSWTPAKHPERHEHRDGCAAHLAETAFFEARRALHARAATDLAYLCATLRTLATGGRS